MRKPLVLCCIVLLCSVALGPQALAAGPDRGDALRSRGAGADDALVVWRAQLRLHRDVSRLLGLLPFAVPSDALDRDDDTIRYGLGLSDDPDPTGARGDEDDEQSEAASPDGDQNSSRDDDEVTRIGRR